MLVNRIKWFSSLIKQRGAFEALKKLKRELHNQSTWIVLQLPVTHRVVLNNSGNTEYLTSQMFSNDSGTFETLASFWPESFPKMTKESLIEKFQSRVSNGIDGYSLKENNTALGAIWYDYYEPHLVNTPLSLQANDKVVRNMFISPKAQGRKLAIKLLAESIKLEREKKTQIIYALVFPSRKASINTFLALGFQKMGELSSKTRLFKTQNKFKSTSN